MHGDLYCIGNFLQINYTKVARLSKIFGPDIILCYVSEQVNRTQVQPRVIIMTLSIN